jgi:hypothetical protein
MNNQVHSIVITTIEAGVGAPGLVRQFQFVTVTAVTVTVTDIHQVQ